MKAIREHKEVEVFFHAVNHHSFDLLLAAANSKVEEIVLYGRVFNPEMELPEAEAEQDYEEVLGQGFVYACQYEDREQATPGASATKGVTLILGWDGRHYEEPISKGGEMLVPLASYKVIGVLDEE